MLNGLKDKCCGDDEKFAKRVETLRNKEVKELLFQKYLTKIQNKRNGNQSIADYFAMAM